MSLLKEFLADAGITPETSAKNSSIGRIFGSEPVPDSEDLQRILSLAERQAYDVGQLIEEYSRRFRRKPDVRLLPVQAVGLYELELLGRANVVAGLGEGKTLLSALGPCVRPWRRPIFLNYKRLLDKTIREFREYAENWHICHKYDFDVTVERLSRESCDTYLLDSGVDFVCVDESHSMADGEGPRFRRARRCLDQDPSIGSLFLTGTPGTDTARQFAHIQSVLLGERAPVPQDKRTLWLWCEALDAKIRGMRRPLGALVAFSSGEDDLEAVRAGWGRKIESVPGNIYSRGAENVPCSIYATAVKFDAVSSRMDEYCAAALQDELLPDGRCFEEMYDKSLILKQLGCGYAKVLDPAPPLEWREARRIIGSFCREVIKQDIGYDTPAQVQRAIREGVLDDSGALETWREIEPTFSPQHKTEWFDLSVIEDCAAWLEEHKSLCWVSSPTFGRKLCEVSGVPFFWRHGLDKDGRSIENYPGGPAILAVRPNMLGRNLQDRWSKNRYVTPASSPTELGQSIGRTARQFQKAPTVEVEFFLSVRENWECLQTARMRARAEISKDPANRLLMSDWCVPDLAEVSGWKGVRWQRTS